MDKISIIAPRSISSLQTALHDRNIKVQSGRLNVVMGERAVIIGTGHEIKIIRGTMHAIANLSLSSAVILDSIDAAELEKYSTVFASSTGEVYMTARGPAAQITLSLFTGLLDDLTMPPEQRLVA